MLLSSSSCSPGAMASRLLHASPRRAASLHAAAKRRPKLRSVAMAGAVRAGVFRGPGDLGEGAGGKHDS